MDRPSPFANTVSRRIVIANSPPRGRPSHPPSYNNHYNNHHPPRGRPSNTTTSTSFPDRYDAHGGRGRSLSPPPAKRFRPRSPSPPRYQQRAASPHNDRKRRDRDDEDRGRDRGGRRDDRDRDRNHDKNDRNDDHSPPPDILNMVQHLLIGLLGLTLIFDRVMRITSKLWPSTAGDHQHYLDWELFSEVVRFLSGIIHTIWAYYLNNCTGTRHRSRVHYLPRMAANYKNLSILMYYR